MTDHYETMGVGRDATAEDIKRQYRKMRSRHHPDREGGDADKMAEVNVAYEVLIDPQRRLHYDRTGQNDAPQLERQAQEIICGMIMGYLHQHDGEQDFSVWIRSALDTEILKGMNNLAEGEKMVRLNEKMLKRLKFKGKGTDYVRVAMEARLRDLHAKIEQNKQVVERYRLALKMSSDYGYEVPLTEELVVWHILGSQFRGSCGLSAGDGI